VNYRLPPLGPSRLAPVAERLAYAAVGVAAVAVLATRSGQVQPHLGIAVLTFGVVLAAAAVAVALVGGLEIWDSAACSGRCWSRRCCSHGRPGSPARPCACRC